MRGWLRKALTCTVRVKKGKRERLERKPPSERLVLITVFSIVAIAALTIIEVVHLVILGSWNAEVFASITGLTGTVSGIVIGSKM